MKTVFLTPILIALLTLVPINVPSSHAQLVGEVCLTEPGSTGCPSSPPTLTGGVGTQLRVAVFVQGSDSILGFDIVLLADHTVLAPADADMTGTILQGSLTTFAKCIAGVAVVNNCSPATSGLPDTLELALIGDTPVTAPASGLLFTAIYNIVGTTAAGSPITIGYQTSSSAECNPSSVSGTTLCIQIINGSASLVPETDQTATFSNSSPDYTLTASPTSLTIKRGTTGTSTITISPFSGFTGTISFSTSVSPSSKKGPTTTLASSSVTITSGSTTDTLTISVPNGGALGNYTISVTGTSGALTRTIAIAITVTK